MVLDRLATLKELEYLNLSKTATVGLDYVRCFKDVGFLNLKLDCGLDRLKTLQQLEVLRMLGVPHDLEMEDVEWMLDK